MLRSHLTALALAALALPVLLGAAPALALERVVRLYDERDGLTVSETCLLAQDSRGFIWIGTIGGLARFDGSEMRTWAPDSVRHVLQVLATGPRGEVIAAGESEPLWRITGDGAEALRGPDGRAIRGWVHATLAADGGLWFVTSDTLRSRDARGAWHAWPRAACDGAPFYRLAPAGGDSVFVATRAALWVASPRRAPRLVVAAPLIWNVQPLGDGAWVAVGRQSSLWRIDSSGARLMWAGGHAADGLAVRDRDVFVMADGRLLRFTSFGPPDTLAPTVQLPNGRPLLVDREGVLWIGGYRGLLALPEPGTVAWGAADGLPSPEHAHNLTRTADAVWVVTWFGSVRIELDRRPPRVVPIGGYSGRIRPDAKGRLWGADLDRGFIRWDGTHPTRFPRPGVHGVYGTSWRRDGSMWLATDDGVFLAPSGSGAPQLVRAPPPTAWGREWIDTGLGPVLEDRRGRLWVGRDDQVCSCDAESLARGFSVPWSGGPIPEAHLVTELVELPDGAIWAATSNAGVQRWTGRDWEPLGGNRALGSLRVYGMSLAPSGGVWVLGAGSLVRVMPEPGPDGWRIVERLGTWQGLPTQQAADIHEDPDGRLWLATLAGVVEVPPEARRARILPPPVELVDVRVDGERMPTGRPLKLSSRRNRVELRFAALSFRDRQRLRYEVRLRPGAPWLASQEPVFRFVDLAPGRYEAEVRASLDGAHWTDPPRRFQFGVAPPWWREWWAMLAFVAALAAALYAAHRVRVAMLLRLERQRTRIAMDLHDEMGSGLGSIGILAGLAADEDVDDDTRRRLARDVAEAAADLGGSLTDIVWSLRRGEDTLESLALRLADRGRRMFPEEGAAFVTRFPGEWPATRLGLELRRNLQLIAVEALHNAARHARASRVTLGLEPDGDGWRLWVGDDGRGFELERDRELGHGLRNMRERAATAGARLGCESAPGRGTRIEVRFSVRGDGIGPVA